MSTSSSPAGSGGGGASSVSIPCSTTSPDGRLGCGHYSRSCMLLAPCCGEWFTCRVCHDEVKNENERDSKLAHTLDRTAVRRVRCMLCAHEQAPVRDCGACGAVLGDYFCGICNLFEHHGYERSADRPRGKGFWHCDGCGICRAGGQANFFHCETCRSCLSIDMREGHQCTPGSGLHASCPLCLNDMHTSRKPSVFLPCRHAMHVECRSDFLRSGNFKCPVCRRSMVDMSSEWARMDQEVLLTPMPEDYLNTWWRVHCNDCLLESDIRFNIIGLKCNGCGSYNTGKIGDGTETHEEIAAGAAATGPDVGAEAAFMAFFAAHMQAHEGALNEGDDGGNDDDEDDDDDDRSGGSDDEED